MYPKWLISLTKMEKKSKNNRVAKLGSIILIISAIITLLLLFSCSVMSSSLRPHALQPTGLLCPWDSPGRNTRVSCPSLFQGIFPTQGLNPGFPRCRWILYHLRRQGSPKKYSQSCPALCDPRDYTGHRIFQARILEWVAVPFSRGSSQPMIIMKLS